MSEERLEWMSPMPDEPVCVVCGERMTDGGCTWGVVGEDPNGYRGYRYVHFNDCLDRWYDQQGFPPEVAAHA